MNKVYTLLLVLLAALFGGNVFGQTSIQNFGTGTGSHTSQTGSTSFIPNPTSGTTWARAGAVAPNAPINLVTASNPLGTSGAYVRAVASSTTSITKFSPWVGYSGGTEFYTSFKVLFGDASAGNTATSGSWTFYQGAGTMYSDASDFAGAQVFTGLRFTYGAGGALALTYRGGGSWINTGLTTSTFSSATVYTIEIVGNNKTSGTINYTYNCTPQTVAVQKFDLYINGTLVGNDLAEAALPANTNITSGTFIGISSTSNVANIFVDDAVTYNSVPTVIGASRTVTFDANGGSGTMSPQTACAATALTTNTFTRAGFTFAGWNTAADGSGTAYADGASFPFSANATLYAVWTPNNNTITFDGNGATGGSTASQTLATGATANLNLNGYTKTGYTFAGWATTAGGAVAYGDGVPYTMGTTNVTLYAVWTLAGSYTVTFNANGGTGTMANQTASTATNLTLNTFTRAGYTFAGWATTAGGTVVYADGALYPFTANATLYAKWTPNNNTITFNGNGATGGSTASQTLATDATANLNANGFTRTGYTFAGWATTAGGAVVYTNGASYTMGTSDITLYANWTPNNNTITFDGNGATGGSMSNQIIATGATATLTTNAYIRTGYTFAGWATTSGGTVAYADGASYTMGTANVTLYAVWDVYVGPCFSMNGPDFSTSGSTFTGDTDAGGSPTTTIRLASASASGSISTTATGVTAGDVTVKFRAKAWSATETSVTVTLDGVSQSVTTVPTTFGEITLSYTSVSANPTLTFSTTSGKRVHIGNVKLFCTPLCTSPTTQASSVTTNTPTTGGFSIGWTDGDGDGTMIVVRPTSSTNTLPLSKTSYTPNLAWTSAGQIDINNRVVFRNSGTAAGPVTGLTPETQYTITAYEYNNTDDCYNLTTPPSTTRWTLSTEPTAHPTSGFSGTTCNATSVDLTVPAISAGADGYLIIRKAGSAPTGLPTDATAYTVGNTFGDATVAAIVTASGTYTISGLTASTTYYFQLIPYNANSGAVAQTFNYLTSGTLLQTSVTTTATSTSAASTVETDATYGYTPNILYASYQSAPVPASASNSIGVHNIIIRDGGSTTDADALPTILTAISYSYTGTANTIRAAALFTTSGSKVADATTVGANTITFTGLSGSDVTTNDNNAGGAKELILRVTFNSTVTDNQKLVFTVTSVTGGAVCSSSQFAAADGGGAFSDNTTDDDNRIEVVADRIVFGTQPASTSVNTNLSAFTIRFQDVNGNLDFDNNRTVTLTATDGGVNMSASASYSITAPHSGIVAFSDVQFTSAPQTAITITANTTGLLTTNTVKSNPFDIFDIPVGSYRTTTDGVWSSSPANNTITWQELKSTGWETMALPSSTYPSTTTTNKVYIFNNVTLNGTNTAKNIIVESTGTLSTSTVTPTFKNLLIKTGGVFNKNPGNGLKFDTDGILEVENGGTFNYSHTNATSRSTNLWAGTEKFHPKSNFVVKETDNSVGSGNQVVESTSDVSLFNGAMFGNFIVDMGTGGGKVPLFVSGLNTKLTNGDC